jgi:hypothetical protein
MNFYKTILSIFLTTVCSILVRGQDVEFKNYSYNENNAYTKLNFSFYIPTSWGINPETIDGTGYFLICKPINDIAIAAYYDCFDTLVFRVKFFTSNLDSALLKMGLQKKSEGMYLTTFEGKIKIEIATIIKGDTYNGLYYTISNDIKCKSGKNKKVEGKYQFIYFSDGKQTICIVTNGRSFEENVFKRIIDSFKFS